MDALFMNQRQYAEHQAVSKQAVTKWKQKGLLILDPRGLVDVKATDKRLRDHFGVLPSRYRVTKSVK